MNRVKKKTLTRLAFDVIRFAFVPLSSLTLQHFIDLADGGSDGKKHIVFSHGNCPLWTTSQNQVVSTFTTHCFFVTFHFMFYLTKWLVVLCTQQPAAVSVSCKWRPNNGSKRTRIECFSYKQIHSQIKREWPVITE